MTTTDSSQPQRHLAIAAGHECVSHVPAGWCGNLSLAWVTLTTSTPVPEITTRAHTSLPLHPALVVGDVFSVEQLVGGRVLAQPVLGGGAGVHEGLGHHRQAGIRDAALVDVEHKLGVLDHVHPETQRQAVRERERERERERSYKASA